MCPGHCGLRQFLQDGLPSSLLGTKGNDHLERGQHDDDNDDDPRHHDSSYNDTGPCPRASVRAKPVRIRRRSACARFQRWGPHGDRERCLLVVMGRS
jgi:hypothetical protein